MGFLNKAVGVLSNVAQTARPSPAMWSPPQKRRPIRSARRRREPRQPVPRLPENRRRRRLQLRLKPHPPHHRRRPARTLIPVEP